MGAPGYGRGLCRWQARRVTTRYLSRTEVAERIGVKPDTLGRYKLPEPDAVIGNVRGWLPRTIDAWDRAMSSRSGP